MIKILYFGRLSDRVGKVEEHLDLPQNISTISLLKSYLNTQHDLNEALDDPSIKTMIDQSLAHGNASIINADEIGFLPPVGGG